MEPLEDGRHRAAKVTGDPLAFDQPRSTLDIMSGSRMMKRFRKEAMLLIPLTGAYV